MKKGLISLFFALAAMMHSVAAVVLEDSFDGTALGADWETAFTPGATAKVSDGKVTLDIGGMKNQYRAFLHLQKTEFNFFENPLVVSISGLDLRGTASSASHAVWFFFGVADEANLNKLYPLEAANGRFFALKRIEFGGKQITQLFALQRKDGVLTGTTSPLANFSTAPIGSVEMTLDGNQWMITVKGSGGGVLGASVYKAAFAGNEKDFSTYHFVTGTYNNVNPTEAGSMDIGEIRITREGANVPVILGTLF